MSTIGKDITLNQPLTTFNKRLKLPSTEKVDGKTRHIKSISKITVTKEPVGVMVLNVYFMVGDRKRYPLEYKENLLDEPLMIGAVNYTDLYIHLECVSLDEWKGDLDMKLELEVEYCDNAEEIIELSMQEYTFVLNNIKYNIKGGVLKVAHC